MDSTSIQAPAPKPVVFELSPEATMAAAMLEMSEHGGNSARRRAASLSAERKVTLRAAQFALKKQQEAAEEGGMFGKWSSELQVAALVASAAATVATCGAGAPLAVAVLSAVATTASATSYAMKQTGADGQMCELNVGGKKITLNYSDGVALAGLGAGAGSAAASAGTAAAEAGKQGAEAANRTSQVAFQKFCTVAADVLEVAAGGAKAGQAYCTVRAGLANAEAVDHGADAKSADNEIEVINSRTDEAIDQYRDAAQLRSKILESIDALMAAQADTRRFIMGRRV